ncbi:MAG: Ig-like domain-containing protein [Coriobacteriia bacterium]|nr:Ig-like domain-containing protein [Coriobacteriia bacterium]
MRRRTRTRAKLRQQRKTRGLGKSLALLLAVVMLSTAGISAIAFAIGSDDVASLDAAYVESTYEDVATEEVINETADADTGDDSVTGDITTGDSAEAPAETTTEFVDDRAEAPAASDTADLPNAADGYIGIEPFAVDPTVHYFALVNGAGPGVDQGFVTFDAARLAANAQTGVNSVIYLVRNASIPGGADQSVPSFTSTLNLNGFTLTANSTMLISGTMDHFTVNANGGTLVFTAAQGLRMGGIQGGAGNPMNQSTATINSNVIASQNAFIAGHATTITVNGNITGAGVPNAPGMGSVVLLAQNNSRIYVTGNVTASAVNLNSTGAITGNTAQIRITGTLTAPNNYVGFGLANNQFYMKAIGDYDPVSELAGYRQYSHNDARRIWVLEPGQQPDPLTAVVTAPSGTVPITTNQVVITFDRAVNTASAGTVSLTGTAGAALDMASAVWSNGNTVLTIPLSGLVAGGSYSVTAQGFVAEDGGTMQAPAIGNFNVPVEQGPDPLEVTNVGPSGNSVPVDTPDLVITFDREVDVTAGGTVTMIWTDANGVEHIHTFNVADGTWSNNNTVLTLPMPPLAPGTAYRVTINSFTAADGGEMIAPFIHNFRTAQTQVPDPDPDQPRPPGEPGEPGAPGTDGQDRRPAQPDDTTAPKTGDNANIVVWIIAFIASFVALGAGFSDKRFLSRKEV